MQLLKSDINKFLFTVLVFFMSLPALPVLADSEIPLSDGELLYVSVYSNVYSGPKKRPFQLAAMLSIRNTDPQYPITVLKVDYYDNNGKMIERYMKDPVELGPLASTHFYVKEYDERGGPGANFIVKWGSARQVNKPVIEGVMLGLASGQGLSFTCPGQPIKEHAD